MMIEMTALGRPLIIKLLKIQINDDVFWGAGCREAPTL